MKILKSFIVFCLLLTVSNISATAKSSMTQEGNGVYKSDFHISAIKSVAFIEEVSTHENNYSPKLQCRKADKGLISIDEDEETEHDHCAKEGISFSLQSVKRTSTESLKESSSVVQYIPTDEHLNKEKVYLLYLVFKI